MDKARIDQFTDTVIEAITDDVRSGIVPWTVTTFGQLHDWVDANMYLEHAGQRYDPDNADSLDEINAIEDEVSRRLGNGAVTGGGWHQVTWTVQQTHRTVLPVALLRPEHRDEPLTAGDVNGEAVAEFEGDTTLVGLTGRTINRVDVVDAPAYVEPPARYSHASILDDPGSSFAQRWPSCGASTPTSSDSATTTMATTTGPTTRGTRWPSKPTVRPGSRSSWRSPCSRRRRPRDR